jgi:NADH:ubiquinone oxidoreductase subunit 6 (subunit J)
MIKFLTIIIILFLVSLLGCTVNSLYAVFSFLFMVLFISVYLFFSGVEFIAIAYLIIYIGAIVVLFLFTIFLFNLQGLLMVYNDNIAVVISKKKFFGYLFLKIIFLLFIFKIFIVIKFIYLDFMEVVETQIEDYFEIDHILISPLGEMKLNFFITYDINQIGYLLYTEFLVYLFFCALILLVSIFGSVILSLNNNSIQTHNRKEVH